MTHDLQKSGEANEKERLEQREKILDSALAEATTRQKQGDVAGMYMLCQEMLELYDKNKDGKDKEPTITERLKKLQDLAATVPTPGRPG